MMNLIKQVIPQPVRTSARHSIYLLMDVVDFLLGRRDKLTPPRKLRLFVGPFHDARYYRAVGEEFFQYLKDLCFLKPNEDVLDVGCGCGQIADVLTKFLDRSATYEGFDIISSLIEWDKRKITSRYPNFHFQLADLFSARYNPKGKYKATEYKFPYEDETFDFVLAKSVFTHMLPQDMENYICQVARVLKSGGRCLISFFLLNEESLKSINEGRSTLNFNYEFENYRTVLSHIPEAAISYDESFVLGLYERYRLEIKQPIVYGSWCDGSNFLSNQDIIIASKK